MGDNAQKSPHVGRRLIPVSDLRKLSEDTSEEGRKKRAIIAECRLALLDVREDDTATK